MAPNKGISHLYYHIAVIVCLVLFASLVLIQGNNERKFDVPQLRTSSSGGISAATAASSSLLYTVVKEPVELDEQKNDIVDWQLESSSDAHYLETVGRDAVDFSSFGSRGGLLATSRTLLAAPTSVPTFMPTINGTNSTNSTDDGHGDGDHGSHHFNLFGGMRGLEVDVATLSFMIIVACVVFLEHFFHELHSSTHDTPFSDMVSAIEKELMIVGSMAFIFKCIVFTTSFLPLDWFHALEFADVLVPITSFMFCSQGFALIIMSIKETETWRKSYHLHLFEILEEYYLKYYADDANDREAAQNDGVERRGGLWRYLSRISCYQYNEEGIMRIMAYQDSHDGEMPPENELPPRYFSVLAGLQSVSMELGSAIDYFCHHTPVLQVITRWVGMLSPTVYSEIEFRILHTAFCEQFGIQQNALQFDEYVRRILEKYILQIITIDPGQWIMITVLSLLNWFRHSADIVFTDGCYGDDDHPSAHDIRVCTAQTDVRLFLWVGVAMLCMNLAVAGFARYYEFKVLAVMNVHSVKDYAPFLQTTESAKSHKKKEHNRLSTEELRIALSAAKEKILFKKGGHGHVHGKNCPNPLMWAYRLINWLVGKHKSVHENDGTDRGKKAAGAAAPATDSARFMMQSMYIQTGSSAKASSRKGFNASMRGNIGHSMRHIGGRPRADSAGSGATTPQKEGSRERLATSPHGSKVHPLPGNGNGSGDRVAPVAVGAAGGTDASSDDSSGAGTPGNRRYSLKDMAAEKAAYKKQQLMTQVSEQNEESSGAAGAGQSVTDLLAKALPILKSPTTDSTKPAATTASPPAAAAAAAASTGGDRMHREMKGIYFMDDSASFFDAVDHMMMLISFYYALWLVNYSSVAEALEDAVEWQLLTLAPALASTAVYLMAIRSAALLKATTMLDPDVLELTLEDAETSKMLGQAVRRKILKRLQSNIDEDHEHGRQEGGKCDSHSQDHHDDRDHDHDHQGHRRHRRYKTKEDHLKNLANLEEELKRLFSGIDTDGSMLLSRAEFKEFLGELHISFSNKRWRQIFREMDRNYDDQISFDELFLFLFPDHNEARAREIKRLKLVGDRVKRYADYDAGLHESQGGTSAGAGGVDKGRGAGAGPRSLGAWVGTPSQKPVLAASGSAYVFSASGRDGKLRDPDEDDSLMLGYSVEEEGGHGSPAAPAAAAVAGTSTTAATVDDGVGVVKDFGSSDGTDSPKAMSLGTSAPRSAAAAGGEQGSGDVELL